MAALTKEPDGGASGFTLGPRTIVATSSLENSGLITPGSLSSTKYRMTLPVESDLDALKVTAETALPDSGFRWRDSRNGAPNIARFVERLGAFLVLVGLAVSRVIATLRTLGADRSTIFQTYFLQIGALSLVGITFGVALGGAIPIALGPLLSARLPIPADFTLHPVPLIEAAIYGLLTALIFTLWPLSRIGDIRAATLFREALSAGKILPPWRYLAVIIVLVGALLAVAVWFSGSAILTLWTVGGITGALTLLAVSALAITYISRKTQKSARGKPALRWALGAIGATRGEATSVVLSLGLGLSVLATVGQIDGNLRDAIARDLPKVAPSYFFIDIQKDQMPTVQKRLDEDPAVSRVQSAPMLRGRVTYINGRPTSEVAGDHWVVRSDRGITYAATQPKTTRLTEGTWWPQDYTGPPLLSFAAEEAAEMGLVLNDEITVNILGRDIVATIANLREVDFSTAEMGFVMTLNPHAVAGCAP
jgi:putative ABC transport system permease protein